MAIFKDNIENINKDYKGWFIGAFVDKSSPFHNEDFEVKWVRDKKGRIKENPDDSSNNIKTMCILISGKVRYTTLNTAQEEVIEHPGEFVFYQPNIPHKTEFLEDSHIIVIRWK